MLEPNADPIRMLEALTPEVIRDRLAKLECEEDALRVLLRSARAREGVNQRRRLARRQEANRVAG
jgi:hypothetical protein